MGNGFKEVAHLRTNKVLYDENYSGIDWNSNREDKVALTERAIDWSKVLEEEHIQELINDAKREASASRGDDKETDWDRNS